MNVSAWHHANHSPDGDILYPIAEEKRADLPGNGGARQGSFVR
jgi:hypothetical protein